MSCRNSVLGEARTAAFPASPGGAPGTEAAAGRLHGVAPRQPTAAAGTLRWDGSCRPAAHLSDRISNCAVPSSFSCLTASKTSATRTYSRAEWVSVLLLESLRKAVRPPGPRAASL